MCSSEFQKSAHAKSRPNSVPTKNFVPLLSRANDSTRSRNKTLNFQSILCKETMASIACNTQNPTFSSHYWKKPNATSLFSNSDSKMFCFVPFEATAFEHEANGQLEEDNGRWGTSWLESSVNFKRKRQASSASQSSVDPDVVQDSKTSSAVTKTGNLSSSSLTPKELNFEESRRKTELYSVSLINKNEDCNDDVEMPLRKKHRKNPAMDYTDTSLILSLL